MSEAYYDSLAPYYKFIYQDWEVSIKRQATVLDSVIRECFGPNARHILDAACGIGTQSIGLAELGYLITASDISAVAIEQARTEAAQRGLTIEFRLADMRHLWLVHQQQFDVVLACDNAVPHLLSEAEIRQAFEQFFHCTTPEGGCLISVRDYASMQRGGTQLYPRLTHKVEAGRLVIFDMWEFEEDYYDLTTYIVEDKGQSTAQARVVRGGRYYCITIAKLEELLKQAGFQRVLTLEERFFQPLIVGLK
jgi:SAM-dependent methyltransferase